MVTISSPSQQRTPPASNAFLAFFVRQPIKIYLLVFVLIVHFFLHAHFNTLDNTGTISLEVSSDSPSQNNDISDPKITVAYAVSFIKCGDKQTHSAGLTDASLILRHSIHAISSRNASSGSRYDYKMYAIVHRQAEECSSALRKVGFEIKVVDPPVKQDEIRGDFLRSKIHREWCCGADEFIKFYAYELFEEPLVVHLDIDFAFYKPMDDLFDSILYGPETERGREARKRLLLEFPDQGLKAQEEKNGGRIDAFITRDWPQVAPFKWPAGYQAGFLVARRDPTVVKELIEIVKEGNYSEGYGWNYGWGNKGYGGWVGAMAMQGLMAYYYDVVRPGTAVELNQCRFNHMGMDVKYNHAPNFNPRLVGHVGECRNGKGQDCEDCMVTPLDQIYCVHYTGCRKPWQCMSNGSSGGKGPNGERAATIDIDTVHLDHCHDLVRLWHDLRSDFEEKLYKLTGDESIKSAQEGTHEVDIFRGHCDGEGNDNYKLIRAEDKTLERVHELYQ